MPHVGFQQPLDVFRNPSVDGIARRIAQFHAGEARIGLGVRLIERVRVVKVVGVVVGPEGFMSSAMTSLNVVERPEPTL
ncbi:MAG: hypothetical protein M5R38_18980 [Candidatus Methylomirabilis sp.]|nr:hypothetical protein [Candidatus Methylomirabilis sp.]